MQTAVSNIEKTGQGQNDMNVDPKMNVASEHEHSPAAVRERLRG
jgi:hypothetical protein